MIQFHMAAGWSRLGLREAAGTDKAEAVSKVKVVACPPLRLSRGLSLFLCYSMLLFSHLITVFYWVTNSAKAAPSVDLNSSHSSFSLNLYFKILLNSMNSQKVSLAVQLILWNNANSEFIPVIAFLDS